MAYQVDGHRREIVDIKSQGNMLISADSQVIRMYDLEKEESLNAVFFPKSSDISSFDFLSLDTLVVGDLHSLKVYDLRLKFSHVSQMEIALVDQVNQVACSDSGEFIGSVGDEGIIEIFDARNSKKPVLFKKISRHVNIGSVLVFRSKKRWEIGSGGYDSSVFLSDYSNGQVLKEFKPGQEEIGINAPFVTGLKFNENGDKLGIARFNGIIQVQESTGGSRKKEKWDTQEFRAHRYAVMDLEFSRDYLVSTGLDGALSMWDLHGGHLPSIKNSIEFEGYKFNSLNILNNGALDRKVKVAVGGFTLKEDPKIFIHQFEI